MKLIHSFSTYTATATSSASGYPASNVANLDPGKRWKAGSFATEQTLTLDMGGSSTATHLFLNNVNFSECSISLWISQYLSFDLGTFYPIQDRAGKRKLWAHILTLLPDTPTSYAKILVSIPITAALDNLETVPAIGNAIVGTAITLPAVSEWSVEIAAQSNSFMADDGSYSKSFVRLQRHIIGMTISGSKAEIDAVPLSWTYAVIYADLGTVADAFLVYRSERTPFSIKSVLDYTVRMTLEERV